MCLQGEYEFLNAMFLVLVNGLSVNPNVCMRGVLTLGTGLCFRDLFLDSILDVDNSGFSRMQPSVIFLITVPVIPISILSFP